MSHNTFEAAALLDRDLRILNVSAGFAVMFERRVEHLLGTSVISILEGDLDKFRADYCPLEHALPSNDIVRMVAIPITGVRFPVDLRFLRLTVEGDAHWLLVVSDASWHSELDRMKSDFVSTVSHELRTPLSSIAGALGLVAAGATGELNEDAAGMIDIALNNTNRLIRLINDLLDVEKLASGKLHFEFRDQSLSALVQAAAREIGPFADQHGITLLHSQKDGDDQVCVDAGRTIQVLTNLLSNAIKFSEPGGTVCLTVLPDHRFHRVEVIDNGSGIPEAFRSRIFDRFAQADGSDSRRVGGTGLGLAISKKIVDRLAGKLWFSDNPEGGTIFSLDLPAVARDRPTAQSEIEG